MAELPEKILTPVTSEQWGVRAVESEQQISHPNRDHKPLVVIYPGSFDHERFPAYKPLHEEIPHQLGADLYVAHMFGMLGCDRKAGNKRGTVYHADLTPAARFSRVATEIAYLQPTKLVLAGYGFGAAEALFHATALKYLGWPEVTVLAHAPMRSFDSSEPLGRIEYVPGEKPDLRDLHNTTPSPDRNNPVRQRLTCVRYLDPGKPESSPTLTIHVTGNTLDRFTHPFAGILPYDMNGAGLRFTDFAELHRLGEHRGVSTSYLSGSEDTKVPPSSVKYVADRTLVPHSLKVLPGINHDWPEDEGKIRYVHTEYLEVIGRLLTTGMVQEPQHLNHMLARGGLPDVSGCSAGERETIVLSAARPLNEYGLSLLRAAADTGTQLAALCSHQADPATYAEAMRRAGTTGVTVDFPKQKWWPRGAANLATLEHPAVADSFSNLGPKRTTGSTLEGKRIFSDDDMRWTPAMVTELLGALDYHKVAGFQAAYYPDLSVLGHADLLAGGEREVTFSGNALGVAGNAGKDFLNLLHYNEDHDAVHNIVEDGNAALLGQIEQMDYDPFDTPERGRRQVFGEVVSEGLYLLLGLGTSYREVGVDFWKYMKWHYMNEINGVIERLTKQTDDDERAWRALASMHAMKAQLEMYEPRDFYTYVQARHVDTTERWPEAINKMPKGMTLSETMAYHGLEKVIKVNRRLKRHSSGVLIY